MDGENKTVSKKEVRINTFGQFSVEAGGRVLPAESSRTGLMWEIFMFLLSNRGHAFFPEEILNSVCPEKNYKDPAAVMRNQLYRMRQALAKVASFDGLVSNIVFSQGLYRWETRFGCSIDSIEFENLAEQGSKLLPEEPGQAEQNLKQAVGLYSGPFLAGLADSEWVIPHRAYYRDLFLRTLFSLAELLAKKESYLEVVNLYEQALGIDYFEESIHLKLIEAYLAAGFTERARAHYSEATAVFYRELGVRPSDEMKNIYRKISIEKGDFELDLGLVQEGLKKKVEVLNGAYLCDPEIFRYFYKLELLRSERSGRSVLLCLLTLTGANLRARGAGSLNEAMNALQDAAVLSLRKGDIITRWNEAQFLLMLPDLSREKVSAVRERIKEAFSSSLHADKFRLQARVESLLPLSAEPFIAPLEERGPR